MDKFFEHMKYVKEYFYILVKDFIDWHKEKEFLLQVVPSYIAIIISIIAIIIN